MTDSELSALEQAAKAATPGPWDWNGGDVVSAIAEDIINPEDCFSTSENNCAYIAAANPAVLLELIQELRQTRKERDWLARTFGTLPDRECPPSRRRWSMECCKMPCEECWLEAAKEAVK